MADPQQVQVETVQHPQLGPLKFPVDMPGEQRNQIIDELMAQRPTHQKIQDYFDSRTATSPDNPLLKTGTQSFISGIAAPFVHPIQAAKGLVQQVSHLNPGDPENPMVSGMARDYVEGGVPYMATKLAGNTLGGIALGEAGGAALRGAARVPELATGVKNYIRPVSDPAIVPPIQTAAEKLAGSIVPKGAEVADTADAIVRNAGNIRDFAAESKNPMRTQAEFEAAVKGAGDQRYNHFNDNILGPIEGTKLTPAEGYGGVIDPAGNTTLRDMQNRIATLNNLLDPAYRKANEAETASALSKSTLVGLKAEHDALVPQFHNKIFDLTGIPVDDIANLRQDFGSLRGLGNNIAAARGSRISKVGLAAESTGGSSIPRPSLIPFLDQAVDAVRGGRGAIADRAIARSWQNLVPLAGDARPLPNPVAGLSDFDAANNLSDRVAQLQADADANQLSKSGGDSMRAIARQRAAIPPRYLSTIKFGANQ